MNLQNEDYHTYLQSYTLICTLNIILFCFSGSLVFTSIQKLTLTAPKTNTNESKNIF